MAHDSGYGGYLFRQRVRESARAAREHGVIHDSQARVRGMDERGVVLRENALFDDQAGVPLIGWATIGSMTTGEPEA